MSMFRSKPAKINENAELPTPSPMRVPVSIEVKLGEPIDGHPIYKVHMTAPTLGKQWDVGYRFKHFRDVRGALSEEDAKVVTAPFPDSKFKSKLGVIGVKLSDEEQTERLVQLEMWLAELITKKAEMGPVTMAILNGFLNLANFSDVELDALVVAKGTGSSSNDGSSSSSSSSSGDGSGGGGLYTSSNVKPYTPLESAARRCLCGGIPLLQHKHRVSKLGALASRNRILRLTRDGLCLVLIESVEGSGYSETKRLDLADVAGVVAGAQTPVLARVVAGAPLPANNNPTRRGSTFAGLASAASSASAPAAPPPTSEEQAAREAMCFSVVPIEGGEAGPGGASSTDEGGGTSETWDLELSPLFADEQYLGQAQPGGSGVVSGGAAAGGPGGAFNASSLPTFSLRDQIVAELSSLIGSNREIRFAPSPKFVGARRGFVFKLGDLGVGYYPDTKPRTLR